MGVFASYSESCWGVGQSIWSWGEEVRVSEGDGVVWGVEGCWWHFGMLRGVNEGG